MKNKPVLIALLFLTVFIMSCEKNDIEKLEYVPGEILFSPYDFISFQRTYRLIDSLNLTIKDLYNYRYDLITTEDSVELIKTILSSKDYLTRQGNTYSVTYIDFIIKTIINFFDLDNNDANDWFDTVESINLTENLTESSNKWGLLKVPEGNEQFWVDELLQYEIIQSASLNHIVELRE